MADNGAVCSMSRLGNVWDNAAMWSLAHRQQNLKDAQQSKSGCVRLHRALLQHQTQALDDRLSKPYGVRTKGGIRLTACHPNRVKAKQRERGQTGRADRRGSSKLEPLFLVKRV